MATIRPSTEIAMQLSERLKLWKYQRIFFDNLKYQKREIYRFGIWFGWN